MYAFFHRCLKAMRWRRSSKSNPDSTAFIQSGESDYTPSPEDYPVFPPPPPSFIINDSAHYSDVMAARKFAGPQGYFEDLPLFALYRFYEFIVLDRVIDYRNSLEAFW